MFWKWKTDWNSLWRMLNCLLIRSHLPQCGEFSGLDVWDMLRLRIVLLFGVWVCHNQRRLLLHPFVKTAHVLNVTHAAAPCDWRSCFETGSPRSGALTHFTPRSVATCVFTATAGKHKHFHWEAENGISRKPHLWHVEMTFLTWGSLTQAMIWCRSCRAKPKQWNYLKKVQNRWVNKKCHKLIKVL